MSVRIKDTNEDTVCNPHKAVYKNLPLNQDISRSEKLFSRKALTGSTSSLSLGWMQGLRYVFDIGDMGICTGVLQTQAYKMSYRYACFTFYYVLLFYYATYMYVQAQCVIMFYLIYVYTAYRSTVEALYKGLKDNIIKGRFLMRTLSAVPTT